MITEGSILISDSSLLSVTYEDCCCVVVYIGDRVLGNGLALPCLCLAAAAGGGGRFLTNYLYNDGTTEFDYMTNASSKINSMTMTPLAEAVCKVSRANNWLW